MSEIEKEPIQLELEAQRQRVDVEHVDMTIRELVRMATEGELIRSPEYQRKFRWNVENESRLIESIFLGLPVPAIYVAANPNGSWELVDGLQRVSTLIHYVSDPGDALSLTSIQQEQPLRLTGLEKLSSFNDTTFSELPTPLRLSFFKRMLRVTALSDKSDMDVRFDLFERLNTGGIALSAQEVRACVYKGELRQVLSDLASSDELTGLLKLQQRKQNDGTMEEQVLKFFAYLEDRESFKGAVKTFLNKSAERLSREVEFEDRIEIFSRAVGALNDIMGNEPFLRPGLSITPLNQFEAVLVAVAEEQRAGVKDFSPQEGWLSDRELVEASTGATNTPRMLERRIRRARELLTGAPVTRADGAEGEVDSIQE